MKKYELASGHCVSTLVRLTGRARTAATLAFLTAGTVAPAAASSVLNDTGAYLCRDFASATDVADCDGMVQDGETGRDRMLPSDVDGWKGFTFRKVCNSGELAGTGSCPVNPVLGASKLTQWSCVLDEWTGLMWEVKLSDHRRGWARMYFWSDGGVAKYVATMNEQRLCGYDDWRLPTPGEALGLVNYAVPYMPGKPMIDQNFFGLYSDYAYWALAREGDQEAIWRSGYTPGGVGPSSGIGPAPIRVVRDAVAPSNKGVSTLQARDDVVVDEVNGLTWARCSVGQSWSARTQSCHGTPKRISWRQAVEYVQHERATTGQSWRIPNIKELFSVVSTTSQLPGAKVNPTNFPDTPAAPYWTSTPTALPANVLHMINFAYGRTETQLQKRNYLRLVR